MSFFYDPFTKKCSIDFQSGIFFDVGFLMLDVVLYCDVAVHRLYR